MSEKEANQGIVIQGGSMQATNIAIGNNASITTEVKTEDNSSVVISDQIEYLNTKVLSLRKKITSKDNDSDVLITIADNLQESLDITQINQEDALFKLRKILEQICVNVYLNIGGNPKNRMLDWLMRKLSEKGAIPKNIFKHMTSIKNFGNAGAHPSGGKYKIQDFEAIFISLIIVVEWYIEDK